MPRRAWSALAVWTLGCLVARTVAYAEPPVEEPPSRRSVRLEVTFVTVETLPVGSRAVARFRVDDGEFSGALFSLAYDYERPVQLRSWDLHDASGRNRIGGAQFGDVAVGQWDALLLPGSHEPIAALELSLVQTRLFPKERRERWQFTEIESIGPPLEHAPEPDSGLTP